MARISLDHVTQFIDLVDGLRADLDPGDAVQTIEWMRTLSAGELHDAVSDWRDAGATWQEIGDVWGISRQAAQERFGTNH